MPDKRQIGPRIDNDLADDYEWFVRERNEDVYKGRLADEVEMALRLHLGMFLDENPEYIANADDEAKRDRLKQYKEMFETAADQLATEPDTVTPEDVAEMNQQIDQLNNVTVSMLNEILNRLDDSDNPESQYLGQ